METISDFQNTLQGYITDYKATGHTLETRRLTGLNCEPADHIGQTLLQAKEFLTSDEYEQMLDALAFNPLDAAYFAERLKTSTQYAVSRDLEQSFHAEHMKLTSTWVKNNREAKNSEQQERLLVAFLEGLMALAKRMDEQLPVILPYEFTREELTAVYTHGSPIDSVLSTITGKTPASLEARIAADLQEQEQRRTEVTSGFFHQRQMAEFIRSLKDVFEHPEDYMAEDEQEE